MVSCHEVLRELSNYIDRDVNPQLRAEIEAHLAQCQRCSMVLDTTRKMLYIVGDDRVFEVPAGFSERLHAALAKGIGA